MAESAPHTNEGDIMRRRMKREHERAERLRAALEEIRAKTFTSRTVAGLLSVREIANRALTSSPHPSAPNDQSPKQRG